MTPPNDILAEIAKDPKKLLEVLKKMDVDGNKTITTQELLDWIKVNAENLWLDRDPRAPSQAHTLAADFKKYGQSALEYEALSILANKDNAMPETVKKYQQAAASRGIIATDLHKVSEVFKQADLVNERQTAPALKRDPEEEREDAEDRAEQREVIKRLKKSKDPKIVAYATDLEKQLDEAEQQAKEANTPKKEDPAIVAIRKEAAQYTIQDASNASIGQLTPLVAAIIGGKVPQR